MLDADSAKEVVRSFVAAWVDTPTAPWWWEHLKTPTRSFPYAGMGSAGIDLLRRLVGPAHRAAWLIIRGDDAAHVGSGTVGSLVEAIADSPFMEYVIASEDGAWAIFDNHHNVLITVGDPPGLANTDRPM